MKRFKTFPVWALAKPIGSISNRKAMDYTWVKTACDYLDLLDEIRKGKAIPS